MGETKITQEAERSQHALQPVEISEKPVQRKEAGHDRYTEDHSRAGAYRLAQPIVSNSDSYHPPHPGRWYHRVCLAGMGLKWNTSRSAGSRTSGFGGCNGFSGLCTRLTRGTTHPSGLSTKTGIYLAQSYVSFLAICMRNAFTSLRKGYHLSTPSASWNAHKHPFVWGRRRCHWPLRCSQKFSFQVKTLRI